MLVDWTPPPERPKPQLDRLFEPAPRKVGWRARSFELLDLSWRLIVLMALLFVATVVYQALFVRVHGFPLYVALTLAFSGYFLAAIVCSLRDLRNWRSVAYVQIIISVAAGVVALLGSNISPPGVIAFAMAVFSASTGFTRLAEIDAAESKAPR